MSNMKIIFMLGAPGSGKTTQCETIQKMFGYTHFSAGELLRQDSNRTDSEYAEIISECMKLGKIVPTSITLSLLEHAIFTAKAEKNVTTFLIDGFPRNQENLDGWLQFKEKFDLQFVLVLECLEDICIARAIKRNDNENSNRLDDNIENLQKRFVSHYKDTVPIIDYFKKLNLVFSIDTTNATITEVFDKIKTFFEIKL